MTEWDSITNAPCCEMEEKILPLVTRIRNIGIGDDLYMRRYYTKWDALRFHKIFRSDADRDLHDHPWDFTSTILRGSYAEYTPILVDGRVVGMGQSSYHPGDVLVRKAEDLHRLEVISGPVWTAVIVGPTRRKWGYQTEKGWVPWDSYLMP